MTTENEISKVLECLAPWIEKTDGEESVGSWETTMGTKMMVKLLELWLTQESRDKVAKMLEYYHPLDRAAMAYALVVYVMTGTKMTFVLSSAGSCGNGVCAGGVCDDGHEDDIQECHGDSALQDHLSDAKGRHANADVCRSHEIHDAPIW